MRPDRCRVQTSRLCSKRGEDGRWHHRGLHPTDYGGYATSSAGYKPVAADRPTSCSGMQAAKSELRNGQPGEIATKRTTNNQTSGHVEAVSLSHLSRDFGLSLLRHHSADGADLMTGFSLATIGASFHASSRANLSASHLGSVPTNVRPLNACPQARWAVEMEHLFRSAAFLRRFVQNRTYDGGKSTESSLTQQLPQLGALSNDSNQVDILFDIDQGGKFGTHFLFNSAIFRPVP